MMVWPEPDCEAPSPGVFGSTITVRSCGRQGSTYFSQPNLRTESSRVPPCLRRYCGLRGLAKLSLSAEQTLHLGEHPLPAAVALLEQGVEASMDLAGVRKVLQP